MDALLHKPGWCDVIMRPCRRRALEGRVGFGSLLGVFHIGAISIQVEMSGGHWIYKSELEARPRLEMLFGSHQCMDGI
jgi:hypothetical protein